MTSYRYIHTHTQGTTGYFTCVPQDEMPLTAIFTHLLAAPLDSFMRQHALQKIGSTPLEETIKAFSEFLPDLPLPLHCLLLEALKLFPDMEQPLQAIKQDLPLALSAEDISLNTSLVYLRAPELLAEEKAWNKFFVENIQKHRFPETPEQLKLPPLYTEKNGQWVDSEGNQVVIKDFSKSVSVVFKDMLEKNKLLVDVTKKQAMTNMRQEHDDADFDAVSALAEKRLGHLGIKAGELKRHTASLSPVALLCPWNINIQVENGSNNFTLRGQGTTYGRGLSQSRAKVSCLMEMVERSTVYFSIKNDEIQDRMLNTPIIRACRSKLLHMGKQALYLNAFPVDASYQDQALYWMEGESADGKKIYVPVQMAGLFCNLDEIDLFEALGSTGIATHSSVEEAKIAALLEIIERDAESNTPFSKSSCFTLTSSDPFVAKLLQAYKSMGINVQFQDITGNCGVPCLSCFVVSRKGIVSRGYGAALSAKKALLSAITETPYAFPGEPSGPCLRNIPEMSLEDMPDWSTGTVKGDLHLLEQVFISNGLMPVYVDLTHKELRFPVIRAFVEHMELTSESDDFRKPPVRLWRNYLNVL